MGQFNVNDAGLLSTFQDCGRLNYQAFGVPVSGPMDVYSHQVANLLLDNVPEAPVLEMTMLGGTFTFDTDTVIAITGAEMQAVKNQKEALVCWQTHDIKAGDTIAFSGAIKGCRTYLAVAGGFDLVPQLGATATNIRSGLGGHAGRALQKGDVISYGNLEQKYSGTLDQIDVPVHSKLQVKQVPIGAIEQDQAFLKSLLGRYIVPEAQVIFQNKYVLRVVMGPQDDAFTDEGIRTFLESSYTVTNQSDRMGYRLTGKPIKHTEGADILSDGIVKGAIQIPGHGEPIIMMADCQTTGGYPKIAHVISVDLDKLAQAKSGDHITFKAIALSEAQALLKEQSERLAQIKEQFSEVKKKVLLGNEVPNQGRFKQVKQYTIKVCGQSYHVTVEEK